MSGETNISLLLNNMTPKLNEGEYVFCTVTSVSDINPEDIIGTFKEDEGWTVILKRTLADKLNYEYSYVASWITLTVHSSLQAVGLTAAFSRALANAGISCNVVAAYYHDHIFVAKQDAEKAMKVLKELSSNN
jgi:hypothetical protein